MLAEPTRRLCPSSAASAIPARRPAASAIWAGWRTPPATTRPRSTISTAPSVCSGRSTIRLDLAWILEGKARLLRRRGDLEAARRLMEEALTEVERHRFAQKSYTTRADFFATQQDFYDFLIDLLMEQHRDAPQALEVSERSLARSLLDGLAASGTDLRHGGAAPELHARERELEKRDRRAGLPPDPPGPGRLTPRSRCGRSRRSSGVTGKSSTGCGPSCAPAIPATPRSPSRGAGAPPRSSAGCSTATPCCWSTGWARSGASSGPSRPILCGASSSPGAPRSRA